jgi:hypothetical protein
MRALIASAIFFISALFMSICSGAPQVIQPDPSFQMMVVDGWELIDAESMSTFNKINGRSTGQYYDFGIKRIKSAHTFDYPYLLVQIKKDGNHPTVDELNRIPKINYLDVLQKRSTEKLNKNKMYFDDVNKAGFAVIDTKDAAGVAVGGFSISYLTSDGYVLVVCYYKKPQMAKYIKDLTYMSTSVLINYAHKYGVKYVYVDPFVMNQNKKAAPSKQLKHENQSPTVAALNHGTIGAAFAAVVMVISFVVRRLTRSIKKKPE